jgi:D-alanyl-D-alanine carboxypeptidase
MPLRPAPLGPLLARVSLLSSLSLGALAFAACSSAVSGTDPTTDASTPPPAADSAPPEDAFCTARDATLASLAADLRKSPVLAVAVTDARCKTRVAIAAEGDAPAKEALFRVGSVTKTYVAATVLTLAQEGKLALTDPVSKYVEGFPVLERVTLDQLLHHTSGLFNFTEDPAFASLRKTERTPRQIVEAALAKPAYFEPGKGFHYSNTNYTLLGMVVEKASGEKLSAALRSRTHGKLGLTRTFLDGEETLPEPLVTGFDTKGRDVTQAEHPSEPWAAGSMVASVGDVSRYHFALFGGGLLAPAAQEALTKDAVATGMFGTSYGAAAFMTNGTVDLGPTVGHGGDIEGFHTDSLYFTSHRTAISAVVNADGADPSAVVMAVAKALLAP